MSKSRSFNPLAPSSEHAPSYYAATVAAFVRAPSLQTDSVTEVCIIGGGFTGLSAALHLAQSGRHVTLLEQSRFGWGASGRNGGQAHVGMRREQSWLEKHVGLADAKQLWDLALDARSHLDTLLTTHNIDCDFRPGLLHADHKARYTADTRAHVDHMRTKYDYPHLRFVDRDEVRAMIATDTYFSGSIDSRGGHLHPLKYALGLARAALGNGAQLYEGSEVTDVSRAGTGWLVQTPQARVRADRVVLACNGYLRGISRAVEDHVMPINNYIAVTEPWGEERAQRIIRDGIAVADSRFVVNYYRMTADHRLLFGGGENYRYSFPTDIKGFVRKHVLKVFPQLDSVRFYYGWGGTLAITPTRMPFIRELDAGFFNLSGFSGLGVLLAPYAGKIIADALAGNRNAFDLLARVPVPKFPGGPALRWPTLVAAMSLYALRDRL